MVIHKKAITIKKQTSIQKNLHDILKPKEYVKVTSIAQLNGKLRTTNARCSKIVNTN